MYILILNIFVCTLGVTMDQVVVDYLSRRSPVHPGIEWRIKFLDIKPNLHFAASNIMQENNSGKQIHGSIVMIIFSSVIFYIASHLL